MWRQISAYYFEGATIMCLQAMMTARWQNLVPGRYIYTRLSVLSTSFGSLGEMKRNSPFFAIACALSDRVRVSSMSVFQRKNVPNPDQ
jgi:hypothetical protein